MSMGVPVPGAGQLRKRATPASGDRTIYFRIRLAAASKASLGVWRPSVMLFRADTMAAQKRPICGLLGMTTPSLAEAMETWMKGSVFILAKAALLAGVPMGTSALMVSRPFRLSMLFSMNSRAMSTLPALLAALVIMAPR